MLRCTLILLVSLAGLPAIATGQVDGLVLEEERAPRGKGVIIELEENKPEDPPIQKGNAGRKQVELIVGGQGEDGVAKRGALIIED